MRKRQKANQPPKKGTRLAITPLVSTWRLILTDGAAVYDEW